jgi:hypothetical protein
VNTTELQQSHIPFGNRGLDCGEGTTVPGGEFKTTNREFHDEKKLPDLQDNSDLIRDLRSSHFTPGEFFNLILLFIIIYNYL